MHHQLRVMNLEKKFRQGDKEQRVLQGVSACFEQGKSYAIIGASGCGKSTLLHILSGLDMPSTGNVFFDHRDIFTFSETEKNKLLNESFGFVFQFHYLVKELSVIENVMMPGLIKGMPYPQAQERAAMLLKRFDVAEKMHRHPTELSGGQQQRVSVARALFNKPIFLFADEPTGNLDEANAKSTIDLLLECCQEWGMGLIICSHDPHVYQQMRYIWRLHNGVLEVVKE